MLTEINIDGLIGPTHHFGGLGVGNVASIENKDQVSHPRQAALEGLQKAWLMASLGIPQFVFLPPIRPRMQMLSDLGFQGTLKEQLVTAREEAPRGLSAAFSSAFMWVANAATITARSDSADGRLHCTPANLISSWHRAAEAAEREPQLGELLAGIEGQWIHRPLPAIMPLRDEGAANHMRLCDRSGLIGFNIFVYGGDDDATTGDKPEKYFPRHTRAASQAVARLHQLHNDRTFFLQQHPQAIDGGVFHNDVIATSCDHLMLHHELAFFNGERELQRLEWQFQKTCDQPLQRIMISTTELPLADAVRSYFFNSQIVKPLASRVDDQASAPRYILVCPHHCESVPSAAALIKRLVSDPFVPIDEVRFVRLAESMANGGGPACLRLRMMLSSEEVLRLNTKLRLTSRLFDRIHAVIEKWYPESLTAADLCQPDFVADLSRVDSALRSIGN